MAMYPVGYGRFGERLRASKRVVAFLACGALTLLACGSAAAAPAPLGAFTEFTIPTAGSSPLGIAAGADANVWFTETNGDKIGRITPTGTITDWLVAARRLAHGRYTLALSTRRGRRQITTRAQVTIA